LLPVIAEFETLGIANYLTEWRDYDCLAGNAATLFIGQQQFEGIVQGIDASGMLLIERPDGSVQTFASGEVSFNNSVL
jgi:BirA family biotin operon repressor/biotin-[acetyl-CoA-carboxylase] ligase